MNTQLRENVHWVGYVDWQVRDFHSFEAHRGATYNAYLVQDEKTALVDTVKAPYADSLLQNISELTELAKVDYVVCNHAEPDHSSALPRVMAALPNATLVCNKKCRAVLSEYFDTANWPFQVVSSGEALSLGRRTLQFIDTPLVHWPESMFTYVPEEKLLFSMDAFGQHYATSQRFDDELPLCTIMEEAKSYYANIVMPYGKRVASVLEQAASLDIEMIAPSHGVIWRTHIPTIMAAYRNWATCRPKPKVLILYDTMWESTGKMAYAIHEGASQPGVSAELLHIRRSSLTRIATEVIDAATLAVGSSTLNGGMMPMVGAVLTYLKGLQPAGKAAFAFGSHGWAKGAPKAIEEYFEALKWEILRQPIHAQYRPGDEALEECREAGRMLAERAREMAPEGKLGAKVCVDP